MLQLRHISKIYHSGSNQVVALDDINIDFPEKGMVFIVGKSGSGKSTLLNILGGLDQMDKGDIIIDGRSTKDFTDSDFDAYRNYHIGFIFQEFNLIDDLSVKENIAIALKIQSKGHDATTIDEALKLVNLEGLGYRKPRELSGGQRQRVAIARALVKNPNIILADEPTGALDSKTGFELLSSLKTLSKDKLIIVVTHDNEFANIFADEIIQILDGHIMNKLITSPEYKKNAMEEVSPDIIKINSGNIIDNKDIVNEKLKENETNYVCLIDKPEDITIAHPEQYDKIFAKEDYSKKFTTKDAPLTEIKKAASKKTNQKAKIATSECFKMAKEQLGKNKAGNFFMILFTTLATSILGFAITLSTISNSSIIANTLKNNDISLGMMSSYLNGEKRILSTENKTELENEYSNNFAIGKEMKIAYTYQNRKSNSPFEMGNFTGIVECENVSDLNLKVIYGKDNFDADSLSNNEIIISDYASYEIRRTGYLGLASDGSYGVQKPENDADVINTSIALGDEYYKIVGIFNTNYEDYLSLLISEVQSSDEASQKSSIKALKSYYYAKIFAPSGTYQKLIDENDTYSSSALFEVEGKDIPIYAYEEDAITSTYSLANISYSNFSSFTSYSELLSAVSKSNLTVKYGSLPDSLTGNQIVISYDWLNTQIQNLNLDIGVGYVTDEQLPYIVEAMEKNTSFKKMNDSSSVDSIIYSDTIDIVAVVDIPDNTVIDASAIVPSYYNNIAYFLSDSFKEQLNSSIYSYDQIFFTLSGSKYSYQSTIKKMEKKGYVVLNMDGSVSFSTSDIEAIQSTSLIVAGIMVLFAFLILINFVSRNRKQEVGILRATGARSRDVIKIFAVEEGLIALVVAILSILFIKIGSTVFNQYLGNLSIGIEIIVFDWLTVLMILAGTLLLVLLSTIIPIISYARMKPIDAIRNS